MGFFGRNKELVVEAPDAAPWGAAVRVDERYLPLVERLSAEAALDSRGYRRRVLLAAALGYAVIGAVLLVCGGTVAALLYLMLGQGEVNLLFGKLLIVAAVIAWAVLGALWVTAEPPEGRPLAKDEAPALFDLIERLRAVVGGPKIHEVLVSRDFNASIVQLPRLGFLGWYRNYLVVGLPLLRGMAEDEAAAVIAHELGHFAGEHGRLASAVYRVRMTWAQLSERLRDGHSANLLRRFFRWYGPWFSAYSFVLARSHEYEADRAAAEATAPGTIAAALVRLTVQADRYDAAWGSFWDRAEREDISAHRPFSACAGWLSGGDAPSAERSLARALCVETGLEDTHPCLADRLGALGVSPQVPSDPPRSAAEAFLGRAADAIAAEFDEQWWAETSPWLEQARAQRRQDGEELAALRAQSAAGEPLTPDQRLREAELVAAFEGEVAAIPLYDALLDEEPDNDAAAWYAALHRLKLEDPSAPERLEGLADRSPHLAAAVWEVLLAHYEGRGEAEAAAAARARLAEAAGFEAEADAEFRTLRPGDPLDAPELSEEERTEFARSVDGIPGLVSVHVGWRLLPRSRQRQQVLLAKVRASADAEDILQILGERLLPYGAYLAFTVAPDTRWLHRKLKQIEGTQLYP